MKHIGSTKKIPLLAQVKAWVQNHRTRTYIYVGLVLITITAGIATYATLAQKLPDIQPAPIVVQPKKIYYSPLTGSKVVDEAATKNTVTGVMIENSPDARPQSGLKDSGVVFEAVAEGGITRFLALYQEQKPALIGPVRSLRIYYLDWLTPFNASVAHVGGSYDALKEVRNGKYRDIDQFFNAGTYWRSSDRYAPHNVYTNFKRLDSLNKQKKYTSSSFTGFARKDEKAAATPTATSITVSISGPLFNSSYRYDAKKNRYNRSQAGQPHKDREKGQITPKAVVVMNINGKSAIGSGKVTIFQNGTVTKGTWHKKNRTSQLSFRDAEDKEIELVRGQTWISAIPNGVGSVSWK